MLTIFISSETQARLITLVDSAKDDSTKLDHLHNQVEQLRRGVAVESLSAEAQTQLQSLLGISEHACEVIIQYRVLKNLAFEGMYGRYEIVNDAHFKTLRWIFNGNLDDSQTEDKVKNVLSVEDDLHDDQLGDGTENLSNSGETSNSKKPGQNNESAVSLGVNLDKGQPKGEEEEEDQDEDEAKSYARESLLNWLSSGAGIFHVSGKLGSGKSTLMKYLCEHDNTKLLLEKWAGGSLNLR
jgi:hypothetical protein